MLGPTVVHDNYSPIKTQKDKIIMNLSTISHLPFYSN